MTIKSTNFNVDKNGKMTCSNANITGGKLDISSEVGTNRVRIFGTDANDGRELSTRIHSGGVRIGFGASGDELDLISLGMPMSGNERFGLISVIGTASDDETRIYNGDANFWQNGSQTYISGEGITTPKVTQTSKESKKKNISKYNEKVLDIVKDSTIYEFNFKNESDTDKKHLGFVIGDEGGKYKTPEQVISSDREGIESYSMTSILWKAVQELIKEIEILKGGSVKDK